MVQKPGGRLSFNFPKRARELFAEAKNKTKHLMKEAISSPLSWFSIFWDGNPANEFPDHLMRISRYLVGLTYVFRQVSVTLLGFFLVIDGFYSIYRNRFEVALTKQWTDDVPRFARSLLGFVLIVGTPVLF